MKANLQATEPQVIRRWEETDLYGRIGAVRKGKPKYILHDGPPYANGRIHIGHALNKVLKDFVIRSKSMAGFDAPYVPGWDCHGLPIELKVDKELGGRKRQMSIAEFRRACRQYAERFVALQRTDFKRLLILGEWEKPYLTMNFEYQAAIVRALGKFVEQEMVYKGRKPVHWCIHCHTALAEAEVEYEDHSSPSIYVEFPLDPASHEELVSRVPEVKGREVSTLIWTTTPWTIPSNLGVAFHPQFAYGLYDVEGRLVIVAEELAEQVATKTGKALGAPVARVPGRVFESIKFRHPLYDRTSLGVLADYVTLDQGTGAVHTAPGHGADDYRTGVKYDLDVYAPVDGSGHFTSDVELFAGLRVFEANPKVVEALARSREAVEARAVRAPVPALLALPSPGDLPGHAAVVHLDGGRRAAAEGAGRGARREVDSRVGRGADPQHAGQPPRLVHLAPAHLGCADPGRRLHVVRRSHPHRGTGREGR